jgi:hypothetical protein
VTYPIAPLGVRMRAAAGVFDPSTDPSTWPWVDITRDVDHLIPIDDEIGSPDDTSEPSTTLAFALKNDASVINGIVGRYTTDNPESDLFPFFDVGCPIEYSLDIGDGGGWDIQVIAFLQSAENAWPSNTQYKSVAKITCVGLLQRGGVINRSQRSPMFRTVMDRRNLFFYPFEDANGSITAASALAFQPAMVPYGGRPAFQFGSQPLVPGVSAGITIGAGQSMVASLSRFSTSNGLRLGFLMFAGTNPAAQGELVSFSLTNGGRYAVEIGPSNLRFRAYDSNWVEISGAPLVGFTTQLAYPVFCEVEVSTVSTGTLRWTLRQTLWTLDPTGTAVGSVAFSTGTFSGTFGTVANVGVAIFGNIDDVWLSSLAGTEVPFPTSGGFAAVLGWAGNTAAGRVAGMCSEADIPSSVTSTAYGVVLGPQLIDTIRANMLDIQNADHGVLSDHMGKVSYRALQELYNLAPAITLTRTVRGQLGQLAPVRDDTAKANRVNLARQGGGSVILEDALDILAKGLYETSPPDINVALDSALTAQAGWYLARGVASGYRYSELTLRMRVAGEYTPTLPGFVAALQLGDRIAITSLPPQAAKGGIERVVRGRKQTVLNRGMMTWNVTYAMVPTEAYQAFILDTDRLDTSGTEVILAATTVDTTIMTATAGALPATGTGQSIALDAAGEQILLTGVATEALADPFTRTVSNGWGSLPATAHLPAYPYTVITTASDYAVTGSAATMLISTAGTFRAATLPGLIMINPDFTVYPTIPVLAAGGDIEVQAYYRLVSGVGYTWRLTAEVGGTVHFYLYTPTNAVIVDMPLPLTHTAGATYGIRSAPIGALHRFKVWLGGAGAEPFSWTVQIQDSTRIVGGYLGLRTGRNASNTNAALTVSWDNLTFNNVQAFTATRSQGGGVVKAQAVGNQIKLWRGKGLGI